MRLIVSRHRPFDDSLCAIMPSGHLLPVMLVSPTVPERFQEGANPIGNTLGGPRCEGLLQISKRRAAAVFLNGRFVRAIRRLA